MLGPAPAGKNVWQRLQGHALPLRNLDGVDPIICGKLIDRPFPTDRLESHFRLERPTVLPSLYRHRLLLPHGSMCLKLIIQVGITGVRYIEQWALPDTEWGLDGLKETYERLASGFPKGFDPL